MCKFLVESSRGNFVYLQWTKYFIHSLTAHASQHAVVHADVLTRQQTILYALVVGRTGMSIYYYHYPVHSILEDTPVSSLEWRILRSCHEALISRLSPLFYLS